ncbi:MAG TPA: protein phosphatase 2C domain-containing protein [Gemmatimonadales bacterium]|jgi:protein phosphatase|nr:protein phosphatase 2C domain-containing protein [Gemmatimonadales bacterium]
MAESIHKPTDADIDQYGVTHVGKVRKENQDHFLISTLSKHMRVDQTSLPGIEGLTSSTERVAWLAMVADGVGSGAGEEAARFALQAIAAYVARSAQAFYTADATEPEGFAKLLEDAAMQCHADLLEHAAEEGKTGRLATTLTLWLGLWPQAYVLQVGDSRLYIYHQGRLTQISRDQTMAEDLVEQGVLTREHAAQTRWAHVLSSAIGGPEAAPVVTRIVREWGTIVLLCSDGLTKHVSDEQIAERLGNLKSSKETAELLLQDALDGGGSDNITVLIGRTVPRTKAAEAS